MGGAGSGGSASLAAVGTALERGAAAPAVLLGGVVFGLCAAAVLGGGGSGSSRLVWIGGVAVLGVAGLVVAAALGRVGWPRMSRAGAVFVALLGALVLWTGFSVLWSIEPDRSWDYLNRGLVYLALALLGVFAGALLPRPARSVALGLLVVV